MDKLRTLIQFIILAAGEEDFGERELGPIHIVKYIYMGDLYYASRHNGDSFTGVQWIFHHYGPWSVKAWKAIEPTARWMDAIINKCNSPKYEKDFIRYQKHDSALFEKLNDTLPLEISGKLRRDIRNYGRNTPELLDMVYKTPPMLKAAPGDKLNLAEVVPKSISAASIDVNETKTQLSKTAFKKKQTHMEELKQRLNEKLESKIKNKEKRRAEAKKRFIEPRYDDIFFEGFRIPESNMDFLEKEGIIEFGPEIWTSSLREEPDDL